MFDSLLILSVAFSLFGLGLLTFFTVSRRWVLIILIPIVLMFSLYSWRAEDYFRAQPIVGVPAGEKFQFLHHMVQGNKIYLWLINVDDLFSAKKATDTFPPQTYVIPRTKNEEDALEKAEEQVKNGIVVFGMKGAGKKDDKQGYNGLNDFQTHPFDPRTDAPTKN